MERDSMEGEVEVGDEEEEDWMEMAMRTETAKEARAGRSGGTNA